MSDQILVSLILLGLLVVLVWGRWRYDGVTLVTLALMVLLDLIPAKEAFIGFGHPAVITVALVLLISKGLEKTGFISMIGDFIRQKISGELQFLFIIMIVAILSFALLDSIIISSVKELKVWMRLIIHIPFIPVVAGMGYEVLKITGAQRYDVFQEVFDSLLEK